MHRADFQRNREDYEISLLPSEGLWHANLDCGSRRTDGQQVIYKYVASRLCSKAFALPHCDFRGDIRASEPRAAWRIGDLANARAKGEL